MTNSIDQTKYEWRTGPWGECSVNCEGGRKIRSVKCTARITSSHSNYEFVSDDYCDEQKRPVNTTSCNNFRCPTWNMGLWGEVCTEGFNFLKNMIKSK